MNNLAQKSNDKELLIEAKLDYSRILSSMGFFKEALAIVNSTQQEQLSPRLKAEYFLGQVTIYNHQKTFASNENDAQRSDCTNLSRFTSSMQGSPLKRTSIHVSTDSSLP